MPNDNSKTIAGADTAGRLTAKALKLACKTAIVVGTALLVLWATGVL